MNNGRGHRLRRNNRNHNGNGNGNGNGNPARNNATPNDIRIRRGKMSGNIAGLVAFVETPATADLAAVTGSLAAATPNVSVLVKWMKDNPTEACEAMTDTDDHSSTVLLQSLVNTYPTVKRLRGDPNGPNNNAELMGFLEQVTELLCKLVSRSEHDAVNKMRSLVLLGKCSMNNFATLDGTDGEIASCAEFLLEIASQITIDAGSIAEDKNNLIKSLRIANFLYGKMTYEQQAYYMVITEMDDILYGLYREFYFFSRLNQGVTDTSKSRAYDEAFEHVRMIQKTMAE